MIIETTANAAGARAVRAPRQPKSLPRPISASDALRVVDAGEQLNAEPWIAARNAAVLSLLYGCGLRISECLELWLNALDFEEHLVIVRDGKGKKDCTVPMPRKLVPELEKQVKRVVAQHRRDLETNNFVGVFMPETLGR